MRLIDADKLILHLSDWQMSLACVGNEKEYEIIEECTKAIEEQPTAYNVEKVVAELACNSRFIDDINEHNIKCISCVIGQKTAIDIVRNGGTD